MKVLVCGGRNYSNTLEVYKILDKLKPTFIVNGGAPGADYLARMWALERGVECLTINADWGKHGRSAGPIRNTKMLKDNPDIDWVIAFPGGKGTFNMIQQAITKGINVRSVAI